MFLQQYGLREQPFGVTPDPRFLYFGEVHREALASLLYGVEAGLGFASLIAEPGTGKTTLLYYLLARYRATARTAFIFESQCTSQELLRNLLLEFEIGDPASDTVCALNRLKEFLAQQARARRRVILMLDEAQNFDDSVLETVRLLSNFETAGSKLLHIILCGQPNLAEKLSQPQLLNVRQRITIASRLRPFAPVDVVKYVAHRLSVAGYRGTGLFTPAALDAVARLSGGVPREINRLCFSAMSLGCALQRDVIDADLLHEVATDLDFSALLNTAATRKALNVPSSEELGREFAAALALGQEAASAAAKQPPAVVAPPPAVVAPPPAVVMQSPATVAPPPVVVAPPPPEESVATAQRPIVKTEARPAKRRETVPSVQGGPARHAPTLAMPLQSWLVSDAQRTQRLKSAFIASVLALLALVAMGTQFLGGSPTPQPVPAATSSTIEADDKSPAAPVHPRPTQRRAAQPRPNPIPSTSTERAEP